MKEKRLNKKTKALVAVILSFALLLLSACGGNIGDIGE